MDIHSTRNSPPPMSIFIHYLEIPPLRVDVLCTQSLNENERKVSSREPQQSAFCFTCNMSAIIKSNKLHSMEFSWWSTQLPKFYT